MTRDEFETLLNEKGPATAYSNITGRHDWGDALYMLPSYMQVGVVRWVAYGADGAPHGSFIRAVMSNDLKEAYARADNVNQAMLPRYATFMNNYMGPNWSSPEWKGLLERAE